MVPWKKTWVITSQRLATWDSNWIIQNPWWLLKRFGSQPALADTGWAGSCWGLSGHWPCGIHLALKGERHCTWRQKFGTSNQGWWGAQQFALASVCLEGWHSGSQCRGTLFRGWQQLTASSALAAFSEPALPFDINLRREKEKARCSHLKKESCSILQLSRTTNTSHALQAVVTAGSQHYAWAIDK